MSFQHDGRSGRRGAFRRDSARKHFPTGCGLAPAVVWSERNGGHGGNSQDAGCAGRPRLAAVFGGTRPRSLLLPAAGPVDASGGPRRRAAAAEQPHRCRPKAGRQGGGARRRRVRDHAGEAGNCSSQCPGEAGSCSGQARRRVGAAPARRVATPVSAPVRHVVTRTVLAPAQAVVTPVAKVLSRPVLTTVATPVAQTLAPGVTPLTRPVTTAVSPVTGSVEPGDALGATPLAAPPARSRWDMSQAAPVQPFAAQGKSVLSRRTTASTATKWTSGQTSTTATASPVVASERSCSNGIATNAPRTGAGTQTPGAPSGGGLPAPAETAGAGSSGLSAPSRSADGGASAVLPGTAITATALRSWLTRTREAGPLATRAALVAERPG